MLFVLINNRTADGSPLDAEVKRGRSAEPASFSAWVKWSLNWVTAAFHPALSSKEFGEDMPSKAANEIVVFRPINILRKWNATLKALE